MHKMRKHGKGGRAVLQALRMARTCAVKTKRAEGGAEAKGRSTNKAHGRDYGGGFGRRMRITAVDAHSGRFQRRAEQRSERRRI